MDVHVDLTEIDENLAISRGEKPELKFDLDKIGDSVICDEFGVEHRFKSLYEKKKTIVIFIRHFLCFVTKEYIDDLSLVPESYLKEANVDLIVIGCGPHKFIKSFKEYTGYKGPLYVDPDRKLYQSVGLYSKHKDDADPLGKPRPSCHVKSSFIMGVLKSTWRGLQYKEFQGDMNQQGGALIIGPGNVLHFHHFDAAAYDHVSLNDLLATAGVQHVNFPKDARVMDL